MASTELAKAYVQIVPSAEGIKGSITNLLSGEASDAGTSSGKSFSSNLISVASKAIAAAGLGKLLSDSISEGMDFDAAISQIAATMGTTTDQITELRDAAKDLGSTTAFSATEAAEGLNILAMAGLNTEEQLETIDDVLNLAAAGSLSLEAAASYTTGAIKGFGDSMDNASYYTDLMAKGATLANTNVNDLGEALSGSAATARSYGQDADSVTVALLRLAEQNVTGSEATTALNRAMADLYTPTSAAKQALNELGVAAYDEAGNARDLNDVMDELSDALSAYDAETANAYKDTIFTTQGLSAFNKMTSSSEETVQGFKDALADCSGSAMQQADTQLDNLKGDVTLFQSALSSAEIAISDKLTPALRSITEFGTDAISTLTQAFEEDGLVGVISAGGEIVNSVVSGITAALPEMLTQGAEIVMSSITGMIESFPETVAQGAEIVTGVITGITDSLADIFDSGAEMVDSLVEGIGEAIPELLGSAESICSELLEGITGSLPTIISKGGEMLTSLVTGIANHLPEIASSAVEIVGSLLSTITTQLPQIISAGIQMLTQLVQGIISSLPQIASAAVTLVTGFVSEIANNLPQILQSGVSLIVELISGIIQCIPQVVSAAGQIISNAAKAFIDYDWLGLGKNIISGIANGIKNGASSIVNAAKDAANSALSAAKKALGISSPSRVMRDAVGRYIPEGIAEGIEENLSPIEDAMEEVRDETEQSIEGRVILGVSSQSAQAAMARLTGTTDRAASGFTQNNYIYSPEALSPSETARQVRNSTRQMVLALQR